MIRNEAIEYQFQQFDLLMEQSKFEMIISEAIGFSSNYSINDIELIHEGIMDKVKSGFNTLIENIKKLWAKFKEVTAFHFGSNIKYLEKYKDTILNKPLKEDKYIMRPFWEGIDNLLKEAVPAFNYSQMKNNLENDDMFLKNTTPFNKYYKKEGDDLVEIAKSTFRGSSKDITVPSSKIPMETLYNFCIKYNDNVKVLENDIKQLDSAKNEINKLIRNLETEVRKSDEDKESDTTSTTPQKIDTVTISSAGEEGAKEGESKIGDVENTNEYFNYFGGRESIYSFLTESYIIYEEDGKPAIPKKVSTTNNNSIDKKSNMTNISQNNKEYNKEDDLKSSVDNIEEDIERVKRYTKLSYQFLNAKMTVMEEAFKAYMFIIRDHVKNYIKSDSSDNSGSKDTGYSKEDQKLIDDAKRLMDDPDNAKSGDIKTTAIKLKDALKNNEKLSPTLNKFLKIFGLK